MSSSSYGRPPPRIDGMVSLKVRKITIFFLCVQQQPRLLCHIACKINNGVGNFSIFPGISLHDFKRLWRPNWHGIPLKSGFASHFVAFGWANKFKHIFFRIFHSPGTCTAPHRWITLLIALRRRICGAYSSGAAKSVIFTYRETDIRARAAALRSFGECASQLLASIFVHMFWFGNDMEFGEHILTYGTRVSVSMHQIGRPFCLAMDAVPIEKQ